MVAVIRTGKLIYGALAYNERKVRQGQAVCLGAINSLARADQQSLRDKADALQRIAERNPRTKRNCVHIALSFAPDDELDAAQLRRIARDYLSGIGFGHQPAYLYRHQDTPHDHVHLVTINITRDGKRIDDSFIGATKSEVARKEIEKRYQLVRAEARDQVPEGGQGVAEAGRPPGAEGGELGAYAGRTVDEVLRAHQPTTLEELNTLLQARGLKVRIEQGQGAEGAAWRGYSLVRADACTGQEKSAAIKASRIFGKGWGSKLEQTLAANAGASTNGAD